MACSASRSPLSWPGCTLRIYEREGLLDPARSTGGTRRYSRSDIDRLTEICALTADGLNLAGIRRVLQWQEEARQLQTELARLREMAGGPTAATPGTGQPRTRRAGDAQGRRRAGSPCPARLAAAAAGSSRTPRHLT